MNAAAEPHRSNVAWGDSSPSQGFNWAQGDDFTIGTAGETYVITGIRVWMTGDRPNNNTPLTDIFSTLNLMGGLPGLLSGNAICSAGISGPASSCYDASGVTTIAAGAIGGPNIIATKVQYAGGVDYQGSSGLYRDLWQVDFTNLNWVVEGGKRYSFFVGGTETNPGVSNGGSSPYLSAANAALAGSTQQGSDDLMWQLLQNSTTSEFVVMDQWSSYLNPWDKATDINVQVLGSQTPEPSTWALLLCGLSGLAVRRRFRG